MSTMTVYSDRVELIIENHAEFASIIKQLYLRMIPHSVDEHEIVIQKKDFTYNTLFIISNNTRSLTLI